jgi:DNA-binding beta-propeller fold protein YncE/4-amino-4-deoxy-L-arabinose transferase-like glycosyltransferase
MLGQFATPRVRLSRYLLSAGLAATGCVLLALGVLAGVGQETSFTAGTMRARVPVVIARSGNDDSPAGGSLGFLALEPPGGVAVVDVKRRSIIRVRTSGGLLSEWGPQLDSFTMLEGPAGIAQTNGSLFVLDAGRAPRIIRLSTEGAVQAVKSLAEYRLYGSRNLTAGPNNTLYLPDTGNNRVLVLSLDGRVLRSIGSRGAEPGQFRQPTAAVLAPDGSVFVSDLENRRIQRFDADFQVLNVWPVPFRTLSLAVDPQGRVYAADSDRRRVVAFSSTGETLGEIDASSNVDSVAVQPDGAALFVLAPGSLERIDLDVPAPLTDGRAQYDWLRLAIAFASAVAIGAALPLGASLAVGAVRTGGRIVRRRLGPILRRGFVISDARDTTAIDPVADERHLGAKQPQDVQALRAISSFFRMRVLLLAGVAALAGWSTVQMWQDPKSATAAWLWSGSVALFSIPWLHVPRRVDWRQIGFLGGLFVLALLPRLLWLDHLPLGLHGDEARHVLVAEDILRTGLGNSFADHAWGIPVWGFVWQAAFVGLLGPSVNAVRIASSVAGALTVVLTYLWAKELAGRNVGLIAAGLILLAHTHLMLSHLGTVNSQAPLLTTLTIWLLTISWQRRSVAAAALAVSAFAVTFSNWSGDRIIVPIVAAGVLYVVLARRNRALLRPVAIFVLGGILIAAAPAAYYLKSPDGVNLILARSDKSILHSAGWNHTLSSLPEKSARAVFERQASGTIGAFIPGGRTDTSSFYTFKRPFMDPWTLAAAGLGLLVLVVSVRRVGWACPPLVIALTLTSTSLIVDTPNYTRLALMMTSTVLLAALGVETVRRLLARTWLRTRVATLLAAAAVLGVALVNANWFFLDYPREGQGQFTLLSVARLAQEYQVPVYVLTPGFNYRHEDLELLDRPRRIQPAPSPQGRAEAPAVWVTMGAADTSTLQDLQRQLPGSRLRSVTDNLGQIVLEALVPN